MTHDIETIIVLFKHMRGLCGRWPYADAGEMRTAAGIWAGELDDLDIAQLVACASRWFNRPTESNFWPNPGNLRQMLPPQPGMMLAGEARMWTASVLSQAASQGHTLTTERQFLTVVRNLASRRDELRRLHRVPKLSVQRACWAAVAAMGGHKGWKRAPDNEFTHKAFRIDFDAHLEVFERDPVPHNALMLDGPVDAASLLAKAHQIVHSGKNAGGAE